MTNMFVASCIHISEETHKFLIEDGKKDLSYIVKPRGEIVVKVWQDDDKYIYVFRIAASSLRIGYSAKARQISTTPQQVQMVRQ